MATAEQGLQARLEEVELFLGFLRAASDARDRHGAVPSSTAICMPMMKACVFLLLYNSVENCVRAAFAALYERLRLSGVRFGDTTNDIQEIWLRQRMKVSAETANASTYLKLMTATVRLVSDETPIQLDPSSLPISGNLDSGLIRDLCKRHGIALVVPRRLKGGVDLDTVKQQRNALAHGDKSFAECGRDYGLEDLDRIFERTRQYLMSFLKSVSAFEQRKAYRSP